METVSLVSVIMPVNSIDKYLWIAMRSILMQNYSYIELILISNRGKLDLIKNEIQSGFISLSSNFKKKIVYVNSGKNIKAGFRRNIGLKEAKGEYILFIDSDDYLYTSDSITKMVNYIETYKDDDVIGTSCIIRDENRGMFIYREDLANIKLIKKIEYADFQNESGFYRFIYKKNFLTKNKCRFSKLERFQDSLFMVNTLMKAGSFHLFPDITYVYRKGHKIMRWNTKMYCDHMIGVLCVLNISYKNSYNHLCMKMFKNLIFTNKYRFPDDFHNTNSNLKKINKINLMIILFILRRYKLFFKFFPISIIAFFKLIRRIHIFCF